MRDELLRYADFSAFLEVFKVVCQHLQEPEDYAALVLDLQGYLTRNRISYCEILVTPSIPWRFERDAEAILEALFETAAGIERTQPVRLRWIFDCVRQFGPEPAQRTAELALANRDRGVLAVGLGGDENSVPAAEFAEVFAWVRAHALHVHIHAGETGPPRNVWEALEVLGANRIGHGIQAARDPKLMQYLKQHAVGLDVCLTSNFATGAWRPIEKNPCWLLLQRGVPVTLNSDDPGLFQTELNAEYALAARAFKLTQSDLEHIALQGLRCSFLPHDEKMVLMQRLQDQITRLKE